MSQEKVPYFARSLFDQEVEYMRRAGLPPERISDVVGINENEVSASLSRTLALKKGTLREAAWQLHSTLSKQGKLGRIHPFNISNEMALGSYPDRRVFTSDGEFNHQDADDFALQAITQMGVKRVGRMASLYPDLGTLKTYYRQIGSNPTKPALTTRKDRDSFIYGHQRLQGMDTTRYKPEGKTAPPKRSGLLGELFSVPGLVISLPKGEEITGIEEVNDFSRLTRSTMDALYGLHEGKYSLSHPNDSEMGRKVREFLHGIHFNGSVLNLSTNVSHPLYIPEQEPEPGQSLPLFGLHLKADLHSSSAGGHKVNEYLGAVWFLLSRSRKKEDEPIIRVTITHLVEQDTLAYLANLSGLNARTTQQEALHKIFRGGLPESGKRR